VALFDFVTPTEEEAIRFYHHAWDVIYQVRSPRILLQLDRSQLQTKVIPNAKCWPNTPSGEIHGCIPFLEVWCPEDIPKNMISQIYRLDAGPVYGELNWEEIAFDAIIQPEDHEKVAKPPPPFLGTTEQEAVQYWLNNPSGPFPPEVEELLSKFFEKDSGDDPVERRLREERAERSPDDI
jgi:hypothetical protein